jgi:hypothetical protein
MTAVGRLASAVFASLLILWLAEPARALQPQDPLEEVRQLYAAAQYERALAAVARPRPPRYPDAASTFESALNSSMVRPAKPTRRICSFLPTGFSS